MFTREDVRLPVRSVAADIFAEHLGENEKK
jgi:hypothetical protein